MPRPKSKASKPVRPLQSVVPADRAVCTHCRRLIGVVDCVIVSHQVRKHYVGGAAENPMIECPGSSTKAGYVIHRAQLNIVGKH
jgi:hypothetical protein